MVSAARRPHVDLSNHRMSVVTKNVKTIALAGINLVALVAGGCSLDGGPRARLGSYPASAFGAKFLDKDSLGSHSYGIGLFENNGLVYTSRGGHIDIAHLRIAADNVRSLYGKTRTHLLNNERELRFKLNVEPSEYVAEIGYPENWEELPQKEREEIAHSVSLELSQYFTYTMTTWHEVLTWFGFKCLFFLPEKSSAFSWEDIYSNLLGTRLGAAAMEDREHSFDEAMTILLKKELEELQIQSRGTAREAARKMKEKYFDGSSYLDVTRSMDIGLYDGEVTPVLAYGMIENAEPQSYPVPSLEQFEKYGFSMNLSIRPREFESGKILKLVYPDGGGKSIYPRKDMAVVMYYIEEEALKEGYFVTPNGGWGYRPSLAALGVSQPAPSVALAPEGMLRRVPPKNVKVPGL